MVFLHHVATSFQLVSSSGEAGKLEACHHGLHHKGKPNTLEGVR
jgi:hypothetical protein